MNAAFTWRNKITTSSGESLILQKNNITSWVPVFFPLKTGMIVLRPCYSLICDISHELAGFKWRCNICSHCWIFLWRVAFDYFLQMHILILWQVIISTVSFNFSRREMFKLIFFKKTTTQRTLGLCSQVTSSASYVRDVLMPRQPSLSAAEMSARLFALCLFPH